MANNCGAPVRYWRIGIIQREPAINGAFSISKLKAFDSSATGAPNALVGKSISVDHVPGTYEVTAPMDTATPPAPILDGQVLLDDDHLTFVTLNVVNHVTPSPWYINVDAGVGNTMTIIRVGIQFEAIHRTSLSDYILSIEKSADNTNWVVADRFQVPGTAIGVIAYQTLNLHGDVDAPPRPLAIGDGFIPGIVSEDSVIKPDNRVYCFERDSMRLVARGLSDENGVYVFKGLDTSKQYLVMAVDDDGAPMKQPSVWDHVDATPGGTPSATMARQTYQNRCAITNWKCNGVYLPGMYPWQVQAVGMGDIFNYTDYSEDPFSTQSGVYSSDNVITAGQATVLRADQHSVSYNAVTFDRRQALCINQMASDVSSTGLTIETIATVTSATGDVYIGVRGGGTRSGDDLSQGWDLFEMDNLNAGTRGYLISSHYNARRVIETCYIRIRQADISIYLKTANLGAVEYTVTLTTPLNATSLYHIVVSIEPGNATDLYIDGVLIDSHALVGSGELRNLSKWCTGYQGNGTLPVANGPVLIASNPYDGGNGSGHFELKNFEMAMFSTYNGPLTQAEVSDLYSEATGTYTNVSQLPNVIGHEADVLSLAPTFYHPMQDTSVTKENPAVTYPGRDRTVNPLENFQSNLPDLLTASVMTIAAVVSGDSRQWFRIAPGVSTEYKHAYMAGPNFSSTRELTFGIAARLTSYPPTQATLVSTHFESPHSGSSRVDLYGILVDSSGVVRIRYRLYTTTGNPVDISTGYTLPLNTNTTLVARLDTNTAEIALFANGTKQFSQPFGGNLHLGRASYVYHQNDSTDVYIRDYFVYNYALADSEIATIS